MLRKFFKKETKRVPREKAEILAKFHFFFDEDEEVDFDAVKQRAIIDDISKKGVKLTVTPVFDKNTFKKLKKRDTLFLIEFSLPPDKISIKTIGLLQWANSDTKHFPAVTELGLEFIDLSAEEKVVISRYVTLKNKKKI